MKSEKKLFHFPAKRDILSIIVFQGSLRDWGALGDADAPLRGLDEQGAELVRCHALRAAEAVGVPRGERRILHWH